mgnify:CR=1 FL=1
MPKVTVGGKTKHYAYTPKGKAAAVKARAKAKVKKDKK